VWPLKEGWETAYFKDNLFILPKKFDNLEKALFRPYDMDELKERFQSHEQNDDDISKDFKVTKERLMQISKKALDRLKNNKK